MTMPIEISFHGIPVSPALRDSVTRRIRKMQRLAPDITGFRVVVELEERRHSQGNGYRVHARLLLPGGDIDAGGSPAAGTAHEDPYVAVRDTFDALKRRLEERLRRRRGDIKHHAAEARRGHIFELYPDTGYGLIRTDDGSEVKFRRSSLAVGGSEDLEIGREVRFIEVPSATGPWAGNVQAKVDKRTETL